MKCCSISVSFKGEELGATAQCQCCAHSHTLELQDYAEPKSLQLRWIFTMKDADHGSDTSERSREQMDYSNSQ